MLRVSQLNSSQNLYYYQESYLKRLHHFEIIENVPFFFCQMKKKRRLDFSLYPAQIWSSIYFDIQENVQGFLRFIYSDLDWIFFCI
jgi:hypothetical protein